jgi:hypothetical protein
MVGAPGRIRSFLTLLCSLGPGDGRIQAAADRAVAGSQPSRVLLLPWFEDFVAHICEQAGSPGRLIAAMDNPGSPLHGKCQVLIEANPRNHPNVNCTLECRPVPSLLRVQGAQVSPSRSHSALGHLTGRRTREPVARA